LNVSEHDKIFVIALRLAPDLAYTFRWPPAEMAYRDWRRTAGRSL